MALAESIKDLIKPPFANYDVVVYFGGGLFALPLINHYFVKPSTYRFPNFEFDIGFPFANYAVSLLSLLFAVYLLGHIIAYCGSLIIERTIDVFNGKVSSAIILSCYSNDKNRDKIITSYIGKRFSNAFDSGKRMRNSLRFLVHFPLLPVYIIMDLVGGLYYYRSRVSRHVLFLARMKLRSSGYDPMTLNSPWYKTLEHCVINNNPTATSRMYNYLVISGLFRSLSFMFMACIWAEYLYALAGYRGIQTDLKPLLSDASSFGSEILGLFLLYIAYGFSWSSYMKFRRRYAEEAIFAYVLAK